MKRYGLILLSLLLLSGSAGMLCLGRDSITEQTVTAMGSGIIQRQLGAAALLTMSTTPEPSPSAAFTPAPEAIPVTTVLEHWEEPKQGQEPAPVMVDGGGSLELRNETGYPVELSALPPLPRMEITDSETPTVLIMHTHGSESYTEPGVSGYRTSDETKNVIAVGEVIRQVLESHGYQVYHDTTLCDAPDFNNAYNCARTVIENAIEQYPGIFLVLDIHRDAIEDSEGNQLRLGCNLDGQQAAQLMLVVGTDAGGLAHPSWQVNLTFAAILQMELDATHPGLMRPLNLRTERFNQDLAPISLLVEVGASGNSLFEAKLSAFSFSEAVSRVLDRCCGKSS